MERRRTDTLRSQIRESHAEYCHKSTRDEKNRERPGVEQLPILPMLWNLHQQVFLSAQGRCKLQSAPNPRARYAIATVYPSVVSIFSDSASAAFAALAFSFASCLHSLIFSLSSVASITSSIFSGCRLNGS